MREQGKILVISILSFSHDVFYLEKWRFHHSSLTLIWCLQMLSFQTRVSFCSLVKEPSLFGKQLSCTKLCAELSWCCHTSRNIFFTALHSSILRSLIHLAFSCCQGLSCLSSAPSHWKSVNQRSIQSFCEPKRYPLTFYHTIPWERGLLKTLRERKRKNAGKKHLLFLHNVFYPTINKFQFFSHFYFIVCKCFQTGPV